MAGFGTKGRVPGSEKSPVHGAYAAAQRSFDEHAGNLSKTVGDTGAAIGGIPGGVQRGLQGAGHGLFGSQTAIGGAFSGLFGGGNERAAAAPVAAPARPATGPTSSSMVTSPTSPARALNIGAQNPGPSYMQQPSMSGGAGAKRTAGKAAKRRKKSKGG